MLDITRLKTSDENFWNQLKELLAWDESSDANVEQVVKDILSHVKHEGDKAVLEYTNKFDRLNCESVAQLKISKEKLKQAYDSISAEHRETMEKSAERIRAYAKRQKMESWSYTEDDGTVLGQKVTPLDKVGLYVPGGLAAYPSSVFMNAIPAKIAGVPEVVMVVPTPDGIINEMVLAAAYIAEVDSVFSIGGAQAVAALAYGTETIPAVDKIVGPGNIYVATAKRMVFGTVGIDMIAGPSEILVICDGKTDPDWVAMDLFSQAEHDEIAQAILISQDAEYLKAVEASIEKLMPSMERKDIIKTSIAGRGGLIHVKDLDEAADVANYIAPEHLELSMEKPEEYVDKIRNAGAIFMGQYTSEALGDYCAGPNHVLPTSRTARFSSPLGVYDFQKRSSLINCSPEGAAKLSKVASVFARGEGLEAHARSAEYRIK